MNFRGLCVGFFFLVVSMSNLSLCAVLTGAGAVFYELPLKPHSIIVICNPSMYSEEPACLHDNWQLGSCCKTKLIFSLRPNLNLNQFVATPFLRRIPWKINPVFYSKIEFSVIT